MTYHHLGLHGDNPQLIERYLDELNIHFISENTKHQVIYLVNMFLSELSRKIIGFYSMFYNSCGQAVARCPDMGFLIGQTLVESGPS